MVKIRKIVFLVGLSVSSVSLAAGFGVPAATPSQTQAKPAQSAQIKQLLSQAQAQSHGNARAAVARTAAAQPQGSSALGATSMSQQAFSNTVKNIMPLSPQQVRVLRQLFNRTQQAASEYPGTPPRPTSSSVMVNLSPGATPPIVRLRKGFVSSLVFIDSTGQPWPIQAYDIGDNKAFNVQWNKKGNTLLVQALDTYKNGNLAVILKGQNTPVMVTLMPGQAAVDYRVDLRVPGLGPNAKATANGLPSTGSPQLLTFLNGIPPNGAKAMTVTGGECEVWLYQSHLYIRTRLTVLSPGWTSSMSSPDGTHVYELMKTPIVLASDHGKITQLQIQGL